MEAGEQALARGFHTFHTFHTCFPRARAPAHARERVRARVRARARLSIQGMEGMEGMEEQGWARVSRLHTSAEGVEQVWRTW